MVHCLQVTAIMTTARREVCAGSVAPDFTLPANVGQVSLADYRGRQHVLLFFMRAFTCPVGMQHAARLAQLYDELQAAHTSVLVIGGGRREDAVHLQGHLHLPFPVLADPERSVYAAYGLDRALHVIQRSATVLIDTQGIICYLNRTTLPFDALNEAAVMAALAQAWMVGQPEPQPQTI